MRSTALLVVAGFFAVANVARADAGHVPLPGDAKYDTLLADVKGGHTEIDYAALREAYAEQVRGLIDGLRQQGVQRVGILGYSFGSQAAGLAVTLWSDLDFVAVVAPVGHHHQSILRSPAAGRIWPWMRRLPP